LHRKVTSDRWKKDSGIRNPLHTLPATRDTLL
jgi:hypothetical protein